MHDTSVARKLACQQFKCLEQASPKKMQSKYISMLSKQSASTCACAAHALPHDPQHLQAVHVRNHAKNNGGVATSARALQLRCHPRLCKPCSRHVCMCAGVSGLAMAGKPSRTCRCALHQLFSTALPRLLHKCGRPFTELWPHAECMVLLLIKRHECFAHNALCLLVMRLRPPRIVWRSHDRSSTSALAR